MSKTGILWIKRDVLAAVELEAEQWATSETGGVFLGYWGHGTGDPVVTHCVGPGPAAMHREERFEPDYDYQLAESARFYRESGRALHYLGDWHTHPIGSPSLSELNRSCLSRIAQCREARVARPIIDILAGRPWEWFAWRYDRIWWFPWRVVTSTLSVQTFIDS